MMGSSEEGRRLLVARAVLVAREVLWLLVYGVLTIAMTWPLVRHLSRAVSDPGDPYLNTWILHWDWFATFTEAPLYHANIFFPAQWTLAFSETLYGIALLTFPLRFAGVDPLTTYNVAMIAGFALSGYGAHVLARVMLDRWLADRPLRELCSFIAGLFFAFVPFRFEHLSHLQHIWAGWIPLLLAALLLLLRKPRLSVALAFVAAYVMNGLSNVHWLLFTAVTVPLFAIGVMALEQRLRDRRTWVWLGSSFLLANLLLVPFLLPYSIASDLYGLERGMAETSGYSARVWDWAVGGSMNRTWNHLNEDLRESERLLFPGFAVLILSIVPLLVRKRAQPDVDHSYDPPDQPRQKMLLRILDLVVFLSLIVGLESLSDKVLPTIESLRERSVPWVVFWVALMTRAWVRYPAWLNTRGSNLSESIRRAKIPVEYWVALSIVVLGVIGSLGLNGVFHSFLYSTLEPFRSLRVPARWAMISYCGLAVTAAIGAAFLLGRLRGWRKTALAALLPLVILAELRAAPILWHLGETRAPHVYHWLADAPISGGVLELPIGGWNEYTYVYRSIIHNRPIVNGISGFTTPFHAELEHLFESDPIPLELIGLLESSGTSTIIVHGQYAEAPLREWLEELLEEGRIIFLRKFDHRLSGDFVFAVASNEPNVNELVDRSGPDPAGRTPAENLAIFLRSGGPLWVGETFGYLDRPEAGPEVRGSLTVTGWALSPYGVREVNLLFQNESVRIPAKLVPDENLLVKHYPWYEEETPRFFRSFETRPDGISHSTDIVVEITDERGEITRLPQHKFRWIRETPRSAPPIVKWDSVELRGLVERLGYEEQVADQIESGARSVESVIMSRLDDAAHLDDRDFIRSLYEVLLDRAPEESGLAMHVERLESGTSRERMIEMFVDSDEFRRKYSR